MATVKYTGPVASFHCPTNADIRSLKVHFSPKQEGTGDPSPENIRNIVGWDGVSVHNDDGVIIPEEYQKVEYLKSNAGAPYINTNIIPTSNIRICIKGAAPSNVSNPGFIFGSRKDSGSTISSEMFWAITWNDYYCYGLGTSRNTKIVTAHSNENFTIDFNCNFAHAVKINNVLSVNNNVAESYSQPIYLFGINTGGSLDYQYISGITIQQFIVYESYNTNIVKNNFVPCRRKSDNKPGMYDTISQTFFVNQGTGEFICGPDVGRTANYKFGILGKNKFPLRATNQFLNTTTGLSNTIPRDMTTGDVYVSISSNNYWQGAFSKRYGISIGDGTVSFHCNDGSYGFGVFAPVLPSTTYTLSHSGFSGKTRVGYYDASGQHLNVNLSKDASSITFTTDENTAYVLIVFCSTSGNDSDYTVSNIQLELGSTATAYEPYDPKHTVYGGWVDLISGEVSDEWGTIYLKDLPGDWNYNSNNVRFQITLPSQYLNGPTGTWNNKNIMSEAYVTSTSLGYGNKQIAQYSNRYVYIRDNDFEGDVDAFLVAVGDTKIVYKLPVNASYFLAPTQLQTFLGQNNVWSNADYVEVEYDLHETEDILRRKQFIIANQPHIVTPAAARFQNFETDIAAPLKECKVYFSPVQAGSGDPSPQNERPITGWTSLNLYKSDENLYLPNPSNAGYISKSGVINVDNTSTYTDLIPVNSGDIISFQCTTVSVNGETNRRIHGYDSSGTWVQQLASGTTASNTVEDRKIFATIPSGVSYIRVSFRNQDTNVRISKENAIEANWYATAGTVYGGYIDLCSNKIWADWAYVEIDKDTGFYVANRQNNAGNYFYKELYNVQDKQCLFSPGRLYESIPIEKSNYFEIGNSWGAESADKYTIWAYASNTTTTVIRFGFPTSLNITTVAEAKAWLEEHGSLIICYPLANPILIGAIDPIALKTFKGQNYLWTNANGDISIKYWKH